MFNNEYSDELFEQWLQLDDKDKNTVFAEVFGKLEMSFNCQEFFKALDECLKNRKDEGNDV